MAQLSGGPAAIRMDRFDVSDLIEGDPIEQGVFTFRIDNGSGNIATYQGVGFTYDEESRLNGGRLFAIDFSAGGATQMAITGLDTRLNEFTKLAREGNDAGALGFAFSEDDVFRGTAFDDYLSGYGGHDNLFGGAGADTLVGGAGNDHLYGQSANGGDDGSDSLSGGDGSDYLQGNAGHDTLDGGAGSDRIQGGQGNDSIGGAAGNDTLNGNLGDDSIDGGDGNDSLRGGQGNDSLSGGLGADRLSGDLGLDTLSGGSGADIFLFSPGSSLFTDAGTDVITDFQNGSDRIGLGFLPTELLFGARQTGFASAVTAAQRLLDGHDGQGEVAVLGVGIDTYLFFSSDGSGLVNSAIQINGVNSILIDSGDFI